MSLSSRSGVTSVVRDKLITARRFHNVAWIGCAFGLALVGTCMQAMTFKGEDTKQYNSDGAPLNMWWRVELMFGLSALYLAANYFYILVAKRWLLYLQYAVQILAAIYVAGNMISDIVVWRQRDTGDYPVVYYAQTEFIIRFWSVIGMLGCHIVLAVATWNLFARLEEITVARMQLKSQFDLEDDVVDVSSGERLLNNLYSQIRLEQYAFGIFLATFMVGLAFRAASFMSYVWANDGDDFWVTWAWWRNCLDMFSMVFFVGPIALYFLLGGFWTRNASQWLSGGWLAGVLILNVMVLAVTWSECNALNGAELAHSECGTGPTNKVQVWFLWNIFSAIGCAACAAVIYTIFFSANHTLREVAAVNSEVKRMRRNEAELLEAEGEDDGAQIIGRGITMADIDAHVHRAGATVSDFAHDAHIAHVHSAKENGFHAGDAEHVGMVMYSLKRRLRENHHRHERFTPFRRD